MLAAGPRNNGCRQGDWVHRMGPREAEHVLTRLWDRMVRDTHAASSTISGSPADDWAAWSRSQLCSGNCLCSILHCLRSSRWPCQLWPEQCSYVPAKQVRYLGLVEHLKELMMSNKTALSAAVYTELSDVEGEINGFMTYDRKVVKVSSCIKCLPRWQPGPCS